MTRLWAKASGQPLTFKATTQEQLVDLVSLYQILENKYAVYWKANPVEG